VDHREDVYRRLQKHLDRQAVGFPATRGGAEIRLLKHIFDPLEADLACHLSYRPEPLEAVFPRVARLAGTPAELARRLEGIARKGGIEIKLRDGVPHYACVPLAVGMYELQVHRLTPEFIADFNAYTADPRFGLEFLGTALPQMRTIPVARSLHPRHQVATFDEVTALMEAAEGPFMVLECICRKKKGLEGHACRVTERSETCLAIGSLAAMGIQTGLGREIPRREAQAILAANQKEGLVLQPSNTRQAEFVCSCCGCCCGMLGLHRRLPRPLDYWVSNFQARVAAEACSACGACARRCPVGAVALPEDATHAVVDRHRCIGCGVCVAVCPSGALTLVQKPAEVTPPADREELYDILMAHKKGPLGKLRLAGRLIADAIRTGHFRRLTD